ncbi:mCG1045662, partial [Mus musculus]
PSVLKTQQETIRDSSSKRDRIICKLQASKVRCDWSSSIPMTFGKRILRGKRSEIFCWRGYFPFKKHSFAS